MFGLLLYNETSAEASCKIRLLKEKSHSFGLDFSDVFPVLLTDNGGEFSNVTAFENDLDEQQKTRMFFCDPNAPYQKPHIENNHTLFRGIVESGTSLDDFTQENVNLFFLILTQLKENNLTVKVLTICLLLHIQKYLLNS